MQGRDRDAKQKCATWKNIYHEDDEDRYSQNLGTILRSLNFHSPEDSMHKSLGGGVMDIYP